MFQTRNAVSPSDLTAIFDIPSSVSQNSSQTQPANDDDDDNNEMFSLDNDNNDTADTHSDVSLEYEYHPSASLSTTDSQQQLNALESAEDVENRHDLYHELYILVLRKRQQKN
ncbi:unnamed protein product [Rotaria magnacalcarata]|uniref:Uncharacterized protein n=1 Tax=Rotaria magnacalcarata TaxID=392030 RepID=A0A815C045_9BILA|nr:unnamed protein product [Rotaria magnacalcarata]CAF1573559.1 unnamed protein product [Rotaria magnacalcarata]CAF1997652.1 unnamed protein product [Rotaria magnacalcarata]CAF3770139.1 unnamed protein product [Rotaria magnacalcarata]CAF4143672.1 unnamed protein product [Rotaria magnacalcarata]